MVDLTCFISLIAQIIAYFNYANRVLNGLGVTTMGDVLGTSPRTER